MTVRLEELSGRLSGSVTLAGDPDWDVARRAWNLAVEQRPAAVVYPESAADIAAIVDLAREGGLGIAFNGGGHNAGPIDWADDVLLVKTERMRGIAIAAEARRARIEAGVLADQLAAAAGEHGLAYLAGTSPDAGVIGYALGGGLSWMVRLHGLAVNTIAAVELVTADGEIRRVDERSEPDLFWAVRGGGGNFGAVTALELELIPLTEIYAGCLFWPIERSREVFVAWRDWIEGVPEACESLVRIFKLPDIPDVPDHLRARSFALVEVAYVGAEADGASLVAPLRARGPEFDTIASIPPSALSTVNMDPPYPVPYHGEGIHLADFPVEAIDAALGVMLDSPLMHFEVRHLGGAASRRSPRHGALGCVPWPFTMMAFGLALDGEMKRVMEVEIALLLETLRPWDSGFRYLNFAESEMDARLIFPPESYERLRQVKATYDPSDVFRANHRIPPASA